MCTVGRCDTVLQVVLVPVTVTCHCVCAQPVKMYLGTCVLESTLCVFQWHVCMNIKVPLPGHVL